MAWVRLLAGAGLAASLACNAYLLVDRHTAHSSTRPPSHHSQARSEAADSAHEPHALPPPARRLVPPDVAKLDREALEHRLAEAEARLEPMLPADERFEHEERAPEYEVRLQPYLDELFDVHPGEEANYQLECHGRLCKLDSNESSIDWRTELQTDIDAIGLFRFNELTEGSVYLSIPEKAQTEAAGTRLAIRVFQSLLMSPLVASCKSEHPERGLIELALRFDHATRRLSAVATGSLADKPSGRCIRKVLDDILATTNVPSDVTVVPEWAVPVGIP